MSSAKQRGNKSSSNLSPSEKGAHSNHPDDVARKQQQQQSQAPSKGSKGGRSSSPTAAATSSSSRSSLGKVFSFLFYLAFLAVAVFAGWAAHHILEEVNQISLRQEGYNQQREQMTHTLEGVMQKVQSLQTAFGGFELMLKNTQQKQEGTEKTVRQGESEINRISEVLQKLQNEILKDLSDGIHVVKDARERDFTSLENTVEERLTELTRSINDNIAEFTEVQKRSQDEINEVKAKLASLGDTETYKNELHILKGAVDDIQASLTEREKAIESLQSTIDLMESDVLSEVKELVNLKQEHVKFKEAADSEHLSLQALHEKVLQVEESIVRLPDDLKRLSDDVLHVKAFVNEQEGDMLPKALGETLQKNSEAIESRFRAIEANLQAQGSPFLQPNDQMESLLVKYDSKLAALEEGIGILRNTLEDNMKSLTGEVRSLSESQLSTYGEVDELRKSVSDLPSSTEALNNIQKQVRALLDQEKPPTDLGQSKDLSSVKRSVDELRSSLGQAESDLKMLRTAVDSLVAYSVKIETNDHDVQSVKSSLGDIRNDLDRLFVKVEKIHENI